MLSSRTCSYAIYFFCVFQAVLSTSLPWAKLNVDRLGSTRIVYHRDSQASADTADALIQLVNAESLAERYKDTNNRSEVEFLFVNTGYFAAGASAPTTTGKKGKKSSTASLPSLSAYDTLSSDQVFTQMQTLYEDYTAAHFVKNLAGFVQLYCQRIYGQTAEGYKLDSEYFERIKAFKLSFSSGKVIVYSYLILNEADDPDYINRMHFGSQLSSLFPSSVPALLEQSAAGWQVIIETLKSSSGASNVSSLLSTSNAGKKGKKGKATNPPLAPPVAPVSNEKESAEFLAELEREEKRRAEAEKKKLEKQESQKRKAEEDREQARLAKENAAKVKAEEEENKRKAQSARDKISHQQRLEEEQRLRDEMTAKQVAAAAAERERAAEQERIEKQREKQRLEQERIDKELAAEAARKQAEEQQRFAVKKQKQAADKARKEALKKQRKEAADALKKQQEEEAALKKQQEQEEQETVLMQQEDDAADALRKHQKEEALKAQQEQEAALKQQKEREEQEAADALRKQKEEEALKAKQEQEEARKAQKEAAKLATLLKEMESENKILQEQLAEARRVAAKNAPSSNQTSPIRSTGSSVSSTFVASPLEQQMSPPGLRTVVTQSRVVPQTQIQQQQQIQHQQRQQIYSAPSHNYGVPPGFEVPVVVENPVFEDLSVHSGHLASANHYQQQIQQPHQRYYPSNQQAHGYLAQPQQYPQSHAYNLQQQQYLAMSHHHQQAQYPHQPQYLHQQHPQYPHQQAQYPHQQAQYHQQPYGYTPVHVAPPLTVNTEYAYPAPNSHEGIAYNSPSMGPPSVSSQHSHGSSRARSLSISDDFPVSQYNSPIYNFAGIFGGSSSNANLNLSPLAELNSSSTVLPLDPLSPPNNGPSAYGAIGSILSQVESKSDDEDNDDADANHYLGNLKFEFK